MDKRVKKIIYWAIGIVILIIGLFLRYINDYYKVDTKKMSKYTIEVDKEENDNWIIYGNKDNDIGFIFYPGGKVDYLAYEVLCKELVSRGITCVLVKMPFNLAVLDIDIADEIYNKYNNIDKWYIGGHSLGGSMASYYLEDNYKKYEGLILLGAYSLIDLSNTDLNILSIYGSEDKILNKKRYKDNLRNCKDLQEYVIEGGNHSYFGMYGIQEGDGEAKITNLEQITMTASYIEDLIS